MGKGIFTIDKIPLGGIKYKKENELAGRKE